MKRKIGLIDRNMVFLLKQLCWFLMMIIALKFTILSIVVMRIDIIQLAV